MLQYHIFRWIDDDKSTSVEVPGSPTSSTSFIDTEELPNGHKFSYVVQAEFDDRTPHPLATSDPPVDITSVNNPPVANADAFIAFQAIPLTGNVLGTNPAAAGYDTDVDSVHTGLRAVLVNGPAHGTLTLNADGSFTYVAASNFNRTDTFTYKANDGTWTRNPAIAMSADSNVTTVTLDVRKPPK